MADFQLIGIEHPHNNDVLLGRGNYVNMHTGNKRFRYYVKMQREQYVATPKCDKPIFAKMIVSTIRNLVPPGRFLMKEKDNNLWSDVGDRKAWDKTRQALREHPTSTKINEATKFRIGPSVGESITAANRMPTSAPMPQAMAIRSSVLTGAPMSQAMMTTSSVPMGVPTPQVMAIASSLHMGMPTPQAMTEASSNKLLSIFNSQMDAAALYPQFPIEPSTRASASWGEDFPLSDEDIDEHEGNNNEHDYAHDNFLGNDDVKHALVNNVASEKNEAFMYDHNGRAFTLTNNFVAGDSEATTKDTGIASHQNVRPNYNRRSSLKINPKYSDAANTSDNSTIETRRGSETNNVTSDSSEITFDPISKIYTSELPKKGNDADISTDYSILSHEGVSPSKLESLKNPDQIDTKAMSDLRHSLLRSSLISCEGNEDERRINFDITKIDIAKVDDLMCPRSRRHSSILSRCSALSNLTNLSRITGRMSICENMSLPDSGIFSMSETELRDWQKEAADWEREAEMDENQAMQNLQPNQDNVKISIT